MMAMYGSPSRKRRVDKEETEQGTIAASLVDSDLVPDAERAARSTTMSFIDATGRRAVSVFLDRDDYEKVEHMLTETLGRLMVECLSAFAHGRNGQIALTTRLDRNGNILNPVQHSVKVNGQTRNMLHEGLLFIHFPDDRVVVSVEPVPVMEGWRLRICVRSNKNSAEFWQSWRDFAREHNYLRGQAFFADGKIIKRKRTYSWDDILLPEKTKRMVRTHVEDFLRHRLRLKEMGVKARRGLILAGPPGTGKTLLGKVLADTLCDYVLQVEGDPLPLVGLEIKTAFAARQGKRSLIQDEAGVIMLSEEAQEDRTLWRLQNAYYYKSVAEDAKRLSKQGGVGDRYCLVFAYGKNGELSDGDVEKFKDKLIFCCPEVARQESFHVRLEHNQENVITVLRILAFCVSSQNDVGNDH